MSYIQIQAILAGIFFGLWPLVMNRSGVTGNVSSCLFSVAVALFTLPFAWGGFSTTVSGDTKWPALLLAGFLGAIGILFFNGMLSKATPQSVSTLFVLMIVAQTSVVAINQVIVGGGAISPARWAGFALAIIASVLLTKG